MSNRVAEVKPRRSLRQLFATGVQDDALQQNAPRIFVRGLPSEAMKAVIDGLRTHRSDGRAARDIRHLALVSRWTCGQVRAYLDEENDATLRGALVREQKKAREKRLSLPLFFFSADEEGCVPDAAPRGDQSLKTARRLATHAAADEARPEKKALAGRKGKRTEAKSGEGADGGGVETRQAAAQATQTVPRICSAESAKAALVGLSHSKKRSALKTLFKTYDEVNVRVTSPSYEGGPVVDALIRHAKHCRIRRLRVECEPYPGEKWESLRFHTLCLLLASLRKHPEKNQIALTLCPGPTYWSLRYSIEPVRRLADAMYWSDVVTHLVLDDFPDYDPTDFIATVAGMKRLRTVTFRGTDCTHPEYYHAFCEQVRTDPRCAHITLL